jgi:hypothetical protein
MKHRTGRNWLALTLCALAAAPSVAQTIYRCGDTYSQQPCTGARTIEPDAYQPSAAERARAAAATRRDAALADAMEKERLRQEAQPAAYVPPAKPRAAAEPRKPDKADTRKLEVVSAGGPGTQSPKGKSGKKKDKAGGKAKVKTKANAKSDGTPTASTLPAGGLARR